MRGMQARRQDFVLGLTAIVLFSLFIGTVLFIAQPRRGATRQIVVEFPHERGLSPLKAGSAVLLSGAIEVGQVKRVEIRQVGSTGPGSAPRTVVVAVAQVDASLPLYGDCQITTDMPLIGGTGTIVITNVGTPGIPLPDGPIEGQPPQGMAAFAQVSRRLTAPGGLIDRLERALDPDAAGSLLAKLSATLSDVNAITASLRQELTPAQRNTLLSKLHLILDDVNATTASIREQMQEEGGTSLMARLQRALDTLHSALSEALLALQENRPVLRQTLASVEHSTRRVDEELLPRLSKELDGQQAGSLLAKIHAALDRMNAALADVQVAAEAGKRMVVLNRPAVDRLIQNLHIASEDLTLGVREVVLDPSRLIWGPGPARENRLVLLSAARDFVQAAAYLDDAAARLEAIQQAGGGHEILALPEQELEAVREALRSAFARFEQAEKYFWEQMK
jgi:ABC-type transporter Mla subunit MlaD